MGFFRLGTTKAKEPDQAEGAAPTSLESLGGVPSTTAPPEVLKEKKSKKPKDQESPSGGASAGPADGRVPAAGAARAQAGLSVNDFISKTKNQQRQGLKPSGPELIAYARYLGIDPVADHDLLWIAVEALEAPLPSDWTEHFDSNDRVFYYNATTRVSSWTHPLEHIYRETYKTIVNFRNANLGPTEKADKLHQLQAEVKQMEHDVHKDIALWSEHTDEQGNRFYFNREERQSTWTDPRPAKCQVLYLRMKMLRLLQSGSTGTAGFGAEHVGGKTEKLSHYTTQNLTQADDESGHKRSKIGDQSLQSMAHEDMPRRSPDPMSEPGTDTDNDDDDRKAKKRKKKKKKKDKEAPVRLGVPQKLGTSQSEPAGLGNDSPGALGPRGGGAAAAGGLGGAAGGGMPGLGSLDEGGLGMQGRAKVKAGIRLQPIGPGAAPGDQPMPGIGGSASVPSL